MRILIIGFHGQGVPYYLIWDGVILIRRILKHYGWSNIKLMGHSLGGIIAFLYAAVYPYDVEALVSLDVVAPIFEFIGKKSVTQMAGLIDKYDHNFAHCFHHNRCQRTLKHHSAIIIILRIVLKIFILPT